MSRMSVPSPWSLSAFATSLPGDFARVLMEIAALGFSHVDLVAEVDRPADHREALADSGLLVSCLALGRNLPPGHTLDAADAGVRRAALTLLQRQVADAAHLGATTVFLVPPLPLTPLPSGERGKGERDIATAMAYFAEGCALLADYASGRMVRLCVENVPGRALPSAAATLDWLERLAHPHLGLLLDVGHCLLSVEDAAAVVRRAGERLGYVHLDDNDGVGDLHWPLFTGRLTEQQLAETFMALREIGYRGTLALELNPANEEPVEALRRGKRVFDKLSEIEMRTG